jgi:hypothetical protein
VFIALSLYAIKIQKYFLYPPIFLAWGLYKSLIQPYSVAKVSFKPQVAAIAPKTTDNHDLFSSIINILACFQALTVEARALPMFSVLENVMSQDF